jgi:hypothetical protein
VEIQRETTAARKSPPRHLLWTVARRKLGGVYPVAAISPFSDVARPQNHGISISQRTYMTRENQKGIHLAPSIKNHTKQKKISLLDRA